MTSRVNLEKTENLEAWDLLAQEEILEKMVEWECKGHPDYLDLMDLEGLQGHLDQEDSRYKPANLHLKTNMKSQCQHLLIQGLPGSPGNAGTPGKDGEAGNFQ